MSEQEPLFADGKDLPGFHSLLGYRQVSWEENEAVLELEINAFRLSQSAQPV